MTVSRKSLGSSERGLPSTVTRPAIVDVGRCRVTDTDQKTHSLQCSKIGDNTWVRYLVTARVKDGQSAALRAAIDNRTLGRGSVAGGEYLRNMGDAREHDDGRVQWVEVCFCATPLAEEREYWDQYFALEKVQDAHARSRCRDENGTEPWSCGDCDCSARLEARLAGRGRSFLPSLRQRT